MVPLCDICYTEYSEVRGHPPPSTSPPLLAQAPPLWAHLLPPLPREVCQPEAAGGVPHLQEGWQLGLNLGLLIFQETQLSVLGVASLPDNLALKKPNDPEVEQEEEKENTNQVETSSSLTEQLKMSFSKLRRSEKEYKATMEEVSHDLEQVCLPVVPEVLSGVRDETCGAAQEESRGRGHAG